jgi:hypothetical protein
LNGVVRGKTIELESEPGLPDGQRVSVTVQAIGASHPSTDPREQTESQRRWAEAHAAVANLTPGEGLKRSFGTWADDADELDEYLATNRQRRKLGRPGIEP